MNMYFYLDGNNQQQGPIEASELPRFGVTRNTKVWKQGMGDWQTAGSISELSGIFPPMNASTTYGQTSSYQPPIPHSQRPDNLLVWSVLATVLCCLPTGIVAIVHSNKVNTLWDRNDYSGSQKAANDAKMWCFISLGLGIVGGIIGFFIGLANS